MKRCAIAMLMMTLHACSASEPVDLGGVELDLWQLPGPGGTPFLDSADDVTIDVVVDGTLSTVTVVDGAAEAIQAAPEGSRVALTLRATGAFGEAVARPEPFEVTPDARPIYRRAILALPGVTALGADAPDGRAQAATCGGKDGSALIVGGAQEGALAFGSFLIDPEEEGVLEGPGLLQRRTETSCTIVDDTVWLLGGCTLDNVPVPMLERSDLRGGPFETAGDPAPPGTTCGTALHPTTDGFALLAADTLQHRDEEGAVIDEVTLPQPHFGGVIASHPAGGLVVAGGFADTAHTEVVTNGRWWKENGELESIAGLGTGALLAENGDVLLALTDDGRLVALTSEGAVDELLSAVQVALGGSRAVAMAPSITATAWVLTEAGTTAYQLSAEIGTESYDLPEPRPGAGLVAGPGGSTWLIGGAADALLLQPH